MSYFQQKRLYSPNFIGGNYSQKTANPNGKLHPQMKKKIRFRTLITVIFFLAVFAFRFTKNVLVGLPDVTKVKDMIFSQATVIEDRNGQPLYKLFEENREYVDYT